ncbi:hypothetical protein [Carboxydothermus pertinax]|uniref:Serine/threonine protein kinase n=1 Tax=Carboxydothermus pertinax TaxID=870242 RepID=A0A1L8CTK3_9THEO|nr:hypothetical protein [Carboxydothermus pertinax]GAV22251.1 serine/threonine protein kinase [Carboxydothermus pertinax]
MVKKLEYFIHGLDEARGIVGRIKNEGFFSGRFASEIELCILELAGNLARHGGGGKLLLELKEEKISLRTENFLPYIPDFSQIFSARGHGLRTVMRIMDEVSLEAISGLPFIVNAVKYFNYFPTYRGYYAEKGLKFYSIKLPVGRLSFFLRPMIGFDIGGDGIFLHQQPDKVKLTLVDALGHGLKAAKVLEMINQFYQDVQKINECDLELLHKQLQGSRGAAMGQVFFDLSSKKLIFTGCGNISTTIFFKTDAYKALTSADGIVGYGKLRTFTEKVALDHFKYLYFHSDGVSYCWLRDNIGKDFGPLTTLAEGVGKYGKNQDDILAGVLVLGEI